MNPEEAQTVWIIILIIIGFAFGGVMFTILDAMATELWMMWDKKQREKKARKETENGYKGRNQL